MRIRRHLSFANICSVLALTVALSTGTAYAASTIFSADIVDGEVKAPDLGAAAVTARTIASGAVRSAAVRDGSLVGADLALGTVGGGQVADGSLTGADIGDRWITGDDLALGSVTGGEVANNSLTGADLAGGGIVTTIDVPAETVPRNRCREVPIPVTGGALAGDVVVVSPGPALQPGLVVASARAASSTQVRATLCNLSGTTQAQITALPVRVLTIR
jgi:hypothetical protein